jgi:hypothetical protein
VLASQGLVTAAGCCDRDAVEIRVSLARLDDARSVRLTFGRGEEVSELESRRSLFWEWMRSNDGVLLG